MLLKIYSMLFTVHCLHAQLYFPDDEGNADLNSYSPPPQEAPAVASSSIADRASGLEYQKYVEGVIAKGISKLTLDVNKILGTSNDVVVFSPISIAGALALVLLGSNGKTFEELTTVLGVASGVDVQKKSLQVHQQFAKIFQLLQNTSGSGLGGQVNLATAAFVENTFPIRSVYKQTAEDLYNSEILNVDFKDNPSLAQKVINAWVSERTNGKINEILSELPSEATKVIIVSTMYFKALWEHPFFEGVTMRKPFYENGRKSPTNTEVEMMANGGFFPYFKDQTLNCEVLGLPYQGNRTVMYVVMPFNSNKQKLKDLETKLTPSDLERLADRTVYTGVILLFPKMHIESVVDLKESLEALGVKSLFNPAESNLALLSPGAAASPVPAPDKFSTVIKNPIAPKNLNEDAVLIFNRQRQPVDCSQVFDPNNNVTTCTEVTDDPVNKVVSYKRFGNKIGRKINTRIAPVAGPTEETLDNIRELINKQSTSNNYQNPGLYADKVLHKVYMDITETGTEAAAATSVSLSRDGSRITFRVDVPFLFFIRHEETKTILFWGTVYKPTPNFSRP